VAVFRLGPIDVRVCGADPRGRYEDKRTGFATKALGPTDAAPFRSSSRRFDGGNSKAPGPGQYDEENHAGFVQDLNKKVVSRNGVFGSTSERFGSGPGVVPAPVVGRCTLNQVDP
jgi:hypothetical protein